MIFNILCHNCVVCRSPEELLLPSVELPQLQVPAPRPAQRAQGAGRTEGGATQGLLQR